MSFIAFILYKVLFNDNNHNNNLSLILNYICRKYNQAKHKLNENCAQKGIIHKSKLSLKYRGMKNLRRQRDFPAY